MPITDYDGQLQTIANNLGESPALTNTDGLLEAIAKGTENIITEDKLDDYLPLAGGTMTGRLIMENGKSVEFGADHSDGSGGFVAQTATGIRIASEAFGYTAAGGYIDLDGQSIGTTNAGRFVITARSNSSTSKELVGKPDGTLTWDGNTIPTKGVNIQAGKTSATTVNANSSANVNITFSPSFNSNSPVVIATVDTGYTGFFVAVGSISTSGANLIINNVSSTSRSVVVGWVAIDI